MMVKTLLKKQLGEIFRTYFYDPKKNKPRSKVSTILFLLLFAFLMVGVLGGMFALLSYALCGAFVAVDMGWMYFCLMGLLAILLGAFGSVFNTYSGLYLSKDNDLLLSMPIPVRSIMVSRLLGVYLMGLMYSAVVILPAIIVYWVTAPLTPSIVIGSLLFVLLISVLVLILSCVLGWVVAKISLKLKHKSFMAALIALVCLGAYYFFYFKAQAILQDLVANALLYGIHVKSAAYPLYLFGRYAEGDWTAIAVFTLAAAALFALLWYVLSRSFLGIVTATGKAVRRVYREKAVQRQSISRALFGKELERFTASANYMLNCGLGTLLLPVGGIALLVKGSMAAELLDELLARPGCTSLLLCTGICMVAAMNDMAAPSVSLEGRNLWLAQSLPILPWQVLKAKLSVQLALTGIPALFCCVCLQIVCPASPVERVLLVLVPLLYVLLSALFGLFLGVKMPNLTWTNELVPIKQSASVMIALLGGWAYGVALAGLYLAFAWRLGLALYLTLFALAMVIGCVVLYRWLKTRGAELFANL